MELNSVKTALDELEREIRERTLPGECKTSLEIIRLARIGLDLENGNIKLFGLTLDQIGVAITEHYKRNLPEITA